METKQKKIHKNKVKKLKQISKNLEAELNFSHEDKIYLLVCLQKSFQNFSLWYHQLHKLVIEKEQNISWS